MTVAAAKRRVHEHQPRPRLRQTIIGLDEHPISRHKTLAAARRAGVEIEAQPERFEDVERRVPFIAAAERRLVLSHLPPSRRPPPCAFLVLSRALLFGAF